MKKVTWKCKGFLGYKNNKHNTIASNSKVTFAEIMELIEMIEPKYRRTKTVKWP